MLFYAFAVLLPRIEDAPEWSASQAAACFSGGLLVSAGAGLLVGRWIDRHGRLGGLGQTLGRLVYGQLANRIAVVPRTVALMAACALTTLALGVVSGPAALLLVLSMLAGMVRGNVTLLQATAVPDRWGPRDYGHRSAVLNAPITVSTAVAPFAVTYGADVLGGYPEVMVALTAVAAVAAALALVTGPARVD